MLKVKNSLSLDNIRTKTKTLPTSSGLIIQKNNSDGIVDIAYIYYDKKIKNCYIKTVADNFQNNIVLYEDFKDFIYLVDAAYDYIVTVFNSLD